MPPVTVKPPAPPITPLKSPAALFTVRDWEPSAMTPVPDSALSEAPAAVAEISNRPLLTSPDEAAMLPLPVSASVPLVIVVAPV